MKSLYLCRIYEDYYNDTRIAVSTSGCGCCSETVAGTGFDSEGEEVFRVDYDKLRQLRADCAEAIKILDGILSEEKTT